MSLAFIYPALPTCLVALIQKSDFHFINVFCVVIVVKNVLCPAQVFSYFVISLVLKTKFTHLRSLLFKHRNGVNCVVRKVYLEIIAKLSQNRVVQLVDYRH